MEVVYKSSLFENLPYYLSDNYTDATITWRNNVYPNQKARLDMYKEQLILLLPEKRYAIIVDPQNVDEVMLYGKTFIWLTPPKESKLKTGYYIRIMEGEQIKLLSKEIISTHTKNESLTAVTSFTHKTRFYLVCQNQYYQVKNAGSFSKIFPEHKKQIHTFIRSNGLNFKQNIEYSLAIIAGFCDELINLNDKQ
jgi:hypothetical protein